MEFTNNELDISSLPKGEEAVLTPIDRRYLKVMLLQRAIFFLFVMMASIIAVAVFEKLQTTSWIAVIVAALVLTLLVNLRLSYLSFLNKAFAVREHDVIYQDGWLVKSLHVFPFNRIQHCSIDSGILERWLGLTTLRIYTAGGNDSDIVIPGLTAEQSSSLRELIIQRNNLDD